MKSKFRLAVSALRWLGVSAVARAVVYAWQRDQAERRWGPHLEGTVWEGWGHVTSVARETGGVRLTLEHGDLEILVLAPDLIRVSWLPGLEPVPYAIAKPPQEWSSPDFEWEERESAWELRTSALALRIGQDGSLTWLDARGRLLREDLPPERAGQRLRHRARLRGEEHIYGLGERAFPLNLRGRIYTLWSFDPNSYEEGEDPIYMSIPVYLGMHSQGSYLVFYENSHRAKFDMGEQKADVADHTFDGGMLRYYFIPGPPPRALERFTELTGRPPLPPLWALGYHQSRYSYYPEARVRKLAADFERHNVPVDVIHLDIHYMHGYRVFTWDRERFPDPRRLADDLRQKGIRLITIIDPGVKVDHRYRLYRESVEKGLVCTLPDGREVRAPVWPGWCVFPDFTKPATRAWWGEQYRTLVESGISGFWNDMNEPTAFAAWGDRTLPLCAHHDMDGRGGIHLEAHNLYGLLMARAGFEGVRRLRPDARPIIISRSGWAGLQRYAWHWTGDNLSDWNSFHLSIPMLINLGLSGIFFTGPDIGGFVGAPSPELYTRWLQAGAFFPFFRSHTVIGSPDQEPWSFGEPYLTCNREAIRLRYRFLPYIYTLAWEAHTRGLPLVRPLWWTDPENPDLWDVDDAFLLGDGVLVAPVLKEGARARSVHLPPGLWYDFWSEVVYEGGKEVEVEAPLERIPLFVRAGTVVPLADPAMNTARRAFDRLELHVFPPSDGEQGRSQLYTDDGEGFEYERGMYRLDEFVVEKRGNRLVLNHSSKGREYPWPYRRTVWRIRGPHSAERAWLGSLETAVHERTLEVDGPPQSVVWRLAD